MYEQQPERESIWSIGRRWLPWYLLLVFAMVIGWTAFVAWFEISRGTHANLAELAQAVVKGTAAAAPLIPIYALLVISTLDLLGSVTMVTYRYLSDKFLRPLHEKLREESERIREEGREKGREEGREKGREEAARKTSASGPYGTKGASKQSRTASPSTNRPPASRNRNSHPSKNEMMESPYLFLEDQPW